MCDLQEAGLTRFAGRNVADYDAIKGQYPTAFEIPFNSTNKWALIVVKKPQENGKLTLYIKGAPERVLARSSHILIDGKQVPITDEIRKAYDDSYMVSLIALTCLAPHDSLSCRIFRPFQYMASRGHRVIGCAQYLLPEDQFPEDFAFSKADNNCPMEGFCFVGLVSLEGKHICRPFRLLAANNGCLPFRST